jgi:hypothetical protein
MENYKLQGLLQQRQVKNNYVTVRLFDQIEVYQVIYSHVHPQTLEALMQQTRGMIGPIYLVNESVTNKVFWRKKKLNRVSYIKYRNE